MNEWNKQAKKAVSVERNGYRDEWISSIHRKWGWNCPAIDVDMIMIEYDDGEPVAIIEYKHINASQQSMSERALRPLRRLSERAQLPFFLVVYNDSDITFCITPRNRMAVEMRISGTMSERDYVDALYRMRGRDLNNDPEFDASSLCGFSPAMAA